MAELLKNMYSRSFFEKIRPTLESTIPSFNSEKFLRAIFSVEWPAMELKQRVRHVSITLDTFLKGAYPHRVQVIVTLAQRFRAGDFREQGFALMFLADFIEQFGTEYFEESMNAMEEVTQLVSCEFAVRPFLLKFPIQTMKRLTGWAKHSNHSVRRFASEGCRPRLPWGLGVPLLKRDPSSIIPILEMLRADPSEYVRRSVANNLNDIAKDHPDLVLGLLKRWSGECVETDWIIRHASRSLLKKGDANALQLQGIKPDSKARLADFQLNKRRVRIGHEFEFQFSFISKEKEDTPFRIDYRVDYLTSTGKVSSKTFKIYEGIVDGRDERVFRKKLSFKDLTTRKHYPGRHFISVLVNGKKLSSEAFNLIR